MRKRGKRLVFDIETEPFSAEFGRASADGERRKHAPKLRVACVYDEAADAYRFYSPTQIKQLVIDLTRADEVVSFNGNRFDLFVLQRHGGLSHRQAIPAKGMHVDIHEIMSEKAGYRVSLNNAVRHNFGERKHTDGRSMDELSIEQLKEACQSDVSQTYRLWKAHEAGELLIPRKTARSWATDTSDDFGGGPGSFMPDICPVCHDVGSVEFVPADDEDMTEGQLAEYLAGTWGYLFCSTCHHQEFWEMAG